MLSDHEHIRDDDLMMYFDAELSEGQSAIVRRHLVDCADCKGRLRALERLHSFVEMVAHDSAKDLPSDEMFAKVSSGIAAQKRAGFGERFRVSVSETVEHRKSVLGTVAVALAAAAVVLGVLFSSDDPPAPAARVLLKRSRTAIAQEDAPAPSGTSVHDVNFGASTGTVFQVDDGDGASLAVVWINDDDGLGGGTDGQEEVPQ